MNKVLITGASGFIGRHCLPLLVAQGYEVHIISRYPGWIENLDVHWHQVDLFDRAAIQTVMTRVRPSHLLHLAWYAVPGKYWTGLENFQWVQVSLDLVRAFAEYGGKRIVSAGSCAEYDWRYGYCQANITPIAPQTPYGTCKQAFSLMLESFCQQTDISCTWGRIFWLYGRYEDPNRLVSSVIRSLLSDRIAQCSAGVQIRDFLYVRDVADILVRLLSSKLVGAIDIGSGIPISIRSLVEYIADRLDRSSLVEFGAIPPKSLEATLVVANPERLRSELNWYPQYDLAGGITETINFWKQEIAV
ncbi:NAD-dependent epimerase/dehydratase family protein [Chamaesiphon sp.]|uniref:NAD-dependent epimerase/dehydratase family protein n=1 Tax=Chamaesiphon sp. TaxID=2814140 RepID=UPI003593504A